MPPNSDFKVTTNAQVERLVLGAIILLKTPKTIGILASYRFKKMWVGAKQVGPID